MMPRPAIFVSAVSKELKSARQLVANTLQFLGYEPVWQDIFGMEEGDLREMLRKQIDGCKGVVQIVGQCYGAEPPAPDEQFGRVSYTQYEALYARQQGKKVWILVLHENFPCDAHEKEPEPLARLQADYRQRVASDKHLFHPLGSPEALEAVVLKLRKELFIIRIPFWIWAFLVVALLTVITGLVLHLAIRQELPRTPEPMTEERAQSVFIAKNYAAAFDAYVELSASTPTNIYYHRRVEESARLGSLKKPFLDHYLALVQRQPNNAVFLNYLGNAYVMIDPADKDGKARLSYEAALRLDPQLPPPMANLGILAYRAGKADEAESLFTRYLAARPDDAQAWVNLGLLHLAKVQANTNDTKAIVSSEQALKKATQIDPGSYSAYKALGRLRLTTGQMQEALEAYQRSLRLNGDQPDVRELLAGEFGDSRAFGAPADDFTTRGLRSTATNTASPSSMGKQ